MQARNKAKTKKTDAKKAELTGTEQIGAMQALTQQSAAWLVGQTARTLRDHPGIPRNPSGRYDARDMIKWAAKRIPEANLSDQEMERALNAAEIIYGAVHSFGGDRVVVALADYLDGIEAYYGEAGLIVVFREMLREWRIQADLDRKFIERVTPDQLRAEIERRVRDEILSEQRYDAMERLDVAVVCDECGRLRRGQRWIVADPPESVQALKGYCSDYPKCSSKKAKGKPSLTGTAGNDLDVN